MIGRRFKSWVMMIAFALSAHENVWPAHAVETASGQTVAAQTLIIGIPFDYKLPATARDIVVGDPALLDSVITTSRSLILTGKKQGSTLVTITDANGTTLVSLPIQVEANLNDLNEIIKSDLGLTNVNIRAVKQTVIISGMVGATTDAERVNDLVRAYFGASSTSETASSYRIINTLKITDREQVMLRVVVSEVQRSLLKQLGVDTKGSWSVGDLTFADATTFPTSRTPTATITPGIKNSRGNSTVTLNALERAGYLKTLAEPTLTAISGESARFTAGGEIPVPTGDICSSNALGIQSCQTNYGYKAIGVTLSFAPVVLNSGRISLHVTTEVTELDPDNGTRTNSGNIPAFRSRKMETTVELASGAALMSAGLIQQQTSSTYDRIPGITSIPVLGQLFQSNDYQNHQSELLISVVPYIAKPFGPLEGENDNQEFITPANGRNTITERLNALYRLKAEPGLGRFGFEVR